MLRVGNGRLSQVCEYVALDTGPPLGTRGCHSVCWVPSLSPSAAPPSTPNCFLKVRSQGSFFCLCCHSHSSLAQFPSAPLIPEGSPLFLDEQARCPSSPGPHVAPGTLLGARRGRTCCPRCVSAELQGSSAQGMGRQNCSRGGTPARLLRPQPCGQRRAPAGMCHVEFTAAFSVHKAPSGTVPDSRGPRLGCWVSALSVPAVLSLPDLCSLFSTPSLCPSERVCLCSVGASGLGPTAQESV